MARLVINLAEQVTKGRKRIEEKLCRATRTADETSQKMAAHFLRF